MTKAHRHCRQFVASLALTVAMSGAIAQETDDIEPGVNTSAQTVAPQPDAIEPGVDTSNDVTPTSAAPADAGRARSTSRAIDSLSLDTSQITGNQELPQVLYIVPWKASDLGDLVGRPVNTLLDEVLSPADREVMKRQVNYYEDLHGDDAEEASQ